MYSNNQNNFNHNFVDAKNIHLIPNNHQQEIIYTTVTHEPYTIFEGNAFMPKHNVHTKVVNNANVFTDKLPKSEIVNGHMQPSKHNPKHKTLEKHYEKQQKKVKHSENELLRRCNSVSSSSSSSSCSSDSSHSSMEKGLNREEKKNLMRIRVKELLNYNGNNQCFDCGSFHVNWTDITYAVFLCVDCAKVHKKEFPDFIDRIKSLEVNDFKKKEYKLLKFAGNNSFRSFLSEFNMNSNALGFRERYLSTAAIYYVKYIIKASNGKKFKYQRPGLNEGRFIHNYNDIYKSLGAMTKLKDKTKGLFHIKNKQTKISDEKMCEETKRIQFMNNLTTH